LFRAAPSLRPTSQIPKTAIAASSERMLNLIPAILTDRDCSQHLLAYTSSTPNRSRKKKPAGRDPVQIARSVVDQVTGASAHSDPPPKKKRPKKKPEHQKDPAAVALGRKGGLKGGKARAKLMTPEERAESARKAARARWSV
jgi:hypothetical protein